MKNGTPDYRYITKPRQPGDECRLNDQGGLSGYCANCGLMRMKHEVSPCPKCGGKRRTNKKPQPAGQIVAIGHTRFTQYTIGNEAI